MILHYRLVWNLEEIKIVLISLVQQRVFEGSCNTFELTPQFSIISLNQECCKKVWYHNGIPLSTTAILSGITIHSHVNQQFWFGQSADKQINRLFATLSNIYDGAFCKNNQRGLKVIKHFREKLHLSCLTGFWVCLWYVLITVVVLHPGQSQITWQHRN